jgi:hypothetical protein
LRLIQFIEIFRPNTSLSTRNCTQTLSTRVQRVSFTPLSWMMPLVGSPLLMKRRQAHSLPKWRNAATRPTSSFKNHQEDHLPRPQKKMTNISPLLPSIPPQYILPPPLTRVDLPVPILLRVGVLTHLLVLQYSLE